MPFNLITLHPATVHFPIALLLMGSLAGLLYLWWQRRPELRILTWGLLMLGWVWGGVATLTGLLAQGGLPPQTPYARGAQRAYYEWLGVAGGLCRALLSPVALSQPSPPTNPADLLDVPSARLWLTGLLLLGMTLVAIGGWLGGELVYTWGVNVGVNVGK